MKIRSIHLGDDGNPETLDVTMTASEVAYLTRHLGKLNEYQVRRYDVGEAYGPLYDFFERFYDGGGIRDYPTPNPTEESK